MITALKRALSFRGLVAIALVVWCAGTGCMMVSYARAASDAAVGVLDHAMAGSMSMDSHACCKAKRSSQKASTVRSQAGSQSLELNLLTTPSTPTPTGVMNCCPLTSGLIVVSSRSQSDDDATVQEQPKSSPFLVMNSDLAPLTVPLRLPNRAHSYLLGCAFLI